MENYPTLIRKLTLGGALISALLITSNSVFAYNQDKTHPALTDEIVDFYNLNFPDKKLTNQEKQWLIQGAIEEDSGERPIFHFYDPVYNRGIAHFSSKEWALKSSVQANYYNSQLTGFAAISGGDSVNDFSYKRALNDYAKGDRERAFVAFGHTLHLLEDAGVPDHTRNDPHPPVLDWGSPYEYEMAKWNPGNFQIAKKLFLTKEKPVNFNDAVDYFDRVANYSNSNFFSKDTVSNKTYSKPNITELARLFITGEPRLFIISKDKDGKVFPIALISADKDKELKSVLVSKEIGSYILDGYWDRLSKEVVLSGAGTLNLFLTEAEKAKTEYANRPQEKPSWFAKLLGLIGVSQLTTSDVKNQGVDNSNNGDSVVTQDLEVTNTLVSPSPLVTKTPVTSVTTPTSTPSPSKTPAPTPKPSATPTSTPKPKLSTAKKSGNVVINEIAWAGTSASATDEWVELYNAENSPIDISSWQLVSNDDSPDIIFPEGTIMQANSYFLIERTDDNAISDITADLAVGFGQGGLNNTGEMVRLFDSAGVVVDVVESVGEAWYFGDSNSKNSMERIDPIKPGNNASYWKSFSGTPTNKDITGSLVNGTPKAKNSVATVVVVTTTGGGGGGGSSSTPTPTLTPTPTPSSSPTPTPSPEPDGDTANLGDVIINEIAWMGTVSSENDEWIELYNTTNQSINLTGWTLKSLASPSFDPDIILSGTISANGYFLLERTDDTTVSDITADQIYTGALGNSGEHLILKDTAGTIINQVDGSAGWPAGDNITKETAQKINNSWVTAPPTPKAENKLSTTTFSVVSPQAVTDLVATLNSPLVVTWSAPDPGDYNIASLSYDLRYLTSAFSDAASSSWWSAATKVASSSLPSVGNEGESQTVTPDIAHEYGQTLYFALKTKVINITTFSVVMESGVSNVASVSFVSAIDTGAWGMFGKDQYHTSLANVSGPVGPSPTINEFPIGPDDPLSGFVNVFRSDALNASCDNGGDNVRLYDHNHNSLGAWPCSGQYFNTWGSNFNSSFNDTIFTEFEQVGTMPCGTFEECENAPTTLSIRHVVLRTDGWTSPPSWSVGQPVADADGNIYFDATDGSSHKLIKLNKDGVKQWEYATNVSIGTPAVLSDGTVYFGRVGAGGTLAFTALSSDGTLKWDYNDASTVKNITVSSKGEPHFTYNSGAQDKLAVLNSDDGSVKTLINGTSLSGFSPVVLDNGTIIVASYPSGGNQFFNAYSSVGLQLWDLAYTGASGNAPADLSYDIATGKTYSAVGSKLLEINSAGSDITPVNVAPGYFAATTVAISSETLYVGFNDINPASGSSLFAINKTNLTTKWSFPSDSRVNDQIIVDNNDNVYFSTESGALYSVNKDGGQNWKIETGTASAVSPALVDEGVVWGYGNKIVLVSD